MAEQRQGPKARARRLLDEFVGGATKAHRWYGVQSAIVDALPDDPPEPAKCPDCGSERCHGNPDPADDPPEPAEDPRVQRSEALDRLRDLARELEDACDDCGPLELRHHARLVFPKLYDVAMQLEECTGEASSSAQEPAEPEPIVRWMLVLESGAGELFYPAPVSKNLRRSAADRLFKLVDAAMLAKRLRELMQASSTRLLTWDDVVRRLRDLARELEADHG